jgi:hypothetical protein
MPECHMEKNCLQGSMLFCCKHSPTQRRRYQISAIRSEELRRLHQNANETQGQEVGLVYYLLVPKQFILVIIWTFDAPAHLVDHGTGQVAGRGQLQSTCLAALRSRSTALAVTADAEISVAVRLCSRRMAGLLAEGSS